MRRAFVAVARLGCVVALAVIAAACNLQSGESKPRAIFFIGVDVSGSFRHSAHYDNALSFLARYIYGHLNGLGGLSKPRELFVGEVGGQSLDEPKAFHPIHDLEGKQIDQIEADLRAWFPQTDRITDFNAFFRQVARISKERNLVLAPITVMVLSDGVPEVTNRTEGPAGSQALYEQIDLSALEYLSKSLTLRLAYADPKTGENWRRFVPHKRVRLWTVDAEVMKGWENQVESGVDASRQDRLWKWMLDNVDYRVRSS
jgi:hypothetical protein